MLPNCDNSAARPAVKTRKVLTVSPRQTAADPELQLLD
jgi:hypothetical protein